MQRSRWLLELPEDATEKYPLEIIHAPATNAAGTPPPWQNTNKPKPKISLPQSKQNLMRKMSKNGLRLSIASMIIIIINKGFSFFTVIKETAVLCQ